MVKDGKGKGKADNEAEATAEEVLIEEESKRLRAKAISRGILSCKRAYPLSKLKAAKTILKSDGKDIVKKGHRKNKYLFCFPGLVAPVAAGKLGDFSHLDSRNPVLYIDFPQGRMKFFGTIVYPKNKYLSLQFSKGNGNIVCEDCFESLVVFSDAWWIGTPEDNPEELRLEMPEALKQDRRHVDIDFSGGAGKAPEKPKKGSDDAGPSGKQEKLAKNAEAVPVSKDEVTTPQDRRLSSRTAGQRRNYAEDANDKILEGNGSGSSDDDSPSEDNNGNDDGDEDDDVVLKETKAASVPRSASKQKAVSVPRSGRKAPSAIDLSSSEDDLPLTHTKKTTPMASKKEPTARKNLKQANLSFFVKPKQKEEDSPMDED